MNVLVTGGGGFLGRYLVEGCLSRGWQVRSLSRGAYPELERLGVETFQADIRQRDAVMAACQGMDCVFHAAALPGVWGKWDTFYSINVTGTQNVIEGCWQNGVSKLIYTSSPSVVFGDDDIINGDESLPYPACYLAHYPHTKALAEQAVIAANGQHGLATVSLRPHLIWGPRDNHLIPRLIQRAKRNQLVQVGDGTNQVSIAYVENVAEGHLQAADALYPGSAVAGKCYFINDDTPVNLWDWIANVLKNLDLPPIKRTISYPTAYRIGQIMEGIYRMFGISSEPKMTRFLASQLAKSHYFNTAAARRDFHFSPKIDPQTALDRLFAYYRQHR
ncbi:MAG: NAD-dependent epimerase/dehydratase family protein [Gemmatimonadetes bacterium]|nr:MAG: NAD-dependent epimerase/dehydratase family protein [Gemmatimonadota bacterium]